MKFSGLIAFITGKILKIPINMNVTSGPPEFQEIRIFGKDYRLKFMEMILLKILKKFDYVTTTGSKTIEYLVANRLDPKKVQVLPDAVDMKSFLKKILEMRNMI